MSRSQIITEADWLHNSDAGEMLWLEFMQPIDLTVAHLADCIGYGEADLQQVVSGDKPMTAELDLRLARYFGMSEGFFLGLQHDYEMLEAKRVLNGAELDRIIPRAA